jgi:hypothetical protein
METTTRTRAETAASPLRKSGWRRGLRRCFCFLMAPARADEKHSVCGRRGAPTLPGSACNRYLMTFGVFLTFMVATGRAAATKYQQTTTYVQVVTQAASSLNWTSPAAIPFGTALGSNQLNAIAGVPGAFVYSPSSGALLPAGTQTLSVIFTPDDRGYAIAKLSVPIVVTPPGSSSFTVGTSSPLPDDGIVLLPDQSSTVGLNIVPLGDFHQPVNLTCRNPPELVSCVFSPAVVRPTTAPVQVALTLKMNQRSVTVRRGYDPVELAGQDHFSVGTEPAREHSGRSPFTRPRIQGAALLALVAFRRRFAASQRALSRLLAVSVLFSLCIWVLGCGFHFNTNNQTTLTIVASSLTESRSISMPLHIVE